MHALLLSGKIVSLRRTREVAADIPVLNLQQRSISEISRSCSFWGLGRLL